MFPDVVMFGTGKSVITSFLVSCELKRETLLMIPQLAIWITAADPTSVVQRFKRFIKVFAFLFFEE